MSITTKLGVYDSGKNKMKKMRRIFDRINGIERIEKKQEKELTEKVVRLGIFGECLRKGIDFVEGDLW